MDAHSAVATLVPEYQQSGLGVVVVIATLDPARGRLAIEYYCFRGNCDIMVNVISEVRCPSLFG